MGTDVDVQTLHHPRDARREGCDCSLPHPLCSSQPHPSPPPPHAQGDCFKCGQFPSVPFPTPRSLVAHSVPQARHLPPCRVSPSTGHAGCPLRWARGHQGTPMSVPGRATGTAEKANSHQDGVWAVVATCFVFLGHSWLFPSSLVPQTRAGSCPLPSAHISQKGLSGPHRRDPGSWSGWTPPTQQGPWRPQGRDRQRRLGPELPLTHGGILFSLPARVNLSPPLLCRTPGQSRSPRPQCGSCPWNMGDGLVTGGAVHGGK